VAQGARGPAPLGNRPLGNRIWRVETGTGPVVQKLYRRRTAWPREEIRALLTWLGGRKTSPRAASRYATERRLLALWSKAGLDVPRDLSAEHPGFAAPHGLVMEYLDGTHMLHLLKRKAETPAAERDRLLRRFAADWKHRHDIALERSDPAFIQEHGSLAHVLVAGDRLVTFDLEQGYRSRGAILPVLAKEVANTLRTLMGRGDQAAFQQDLRSLVVGYDDTPRLTAVADYYLRNPNPLRALVWILDRWRERRLGRRASKYEALEALESVLGEGCEAHQTPIA
jgi:hypothetical protein